MKTASTLLTATANESSTAEIITAAVSLMGIGLVVIWIFLMIFANWRIFKKADEPGWKSIVPVLNVFTLYKIAWSPLFFWLEIILIVVRLVFTTFASLKFMPPVIKSLAAGTMAIPLIVMLVVSIFLPLIMLFKLSLSFDKSIIFSLGLIFMYPVFILILGFGKAEYAGPGGSKKEDDGDD